MQLTQLLLGAILGAVIFVPVGYIIRVWLSRTTETSGRSPCMDEIYDTLTRLQQHQDAWGTSLGVYKQDLQLMDSKLTLMSVEMADFFDKTRKSEERQRGLMRRTEAAMGEDGDTSEADQQMFQFMKQHQEDLAATAGPPVGSRDDYYASRTRGE